MMGKRFQLRLLFLLMGALVSMPFMIMMSFMQQREPTFLTESDPCWKSTDTAHFECWIPPDMLKIGGAFDNALKDVTSHGGIVYLVVVDTIQIELALNLYEASFKPQKILNFLFVCGDRTAVDLMFVRGIECYSYPYPHENRAPHEYRELSGIWRTQMKTKLVLSALLLGYAVVHLDVDVVLRRDILQFIKSSKSDLLLPSDFRDTPFAYYYARPSDWVKELHIQALELHRVTSEPKRSEQLILSQALDITNEKSKELPIGIFDPIYFPDKYHSYKNGTTCSECAIVQCTDSSSIEGKIYQLKESKLWMLDFGYYSNRGRKYITYQNPIDFGGKTTELELMALKNALFLGVLLNRTVVLPKFSCGACKDKCSPSKQKCALDAHISISAFDHHFSGKYRESAFLSHPFVPRRVKKSTSKTILIKTEFVRLRDSKFMRANATRGKKELLIFTPSNPIAGTRPENILRWFNKPAFKKLSILKFCFLYDVFKWPLPSWSMEFVIFESKIKELLLTKSRVKVSGKGVDIWQDIITKVFSFFQFFNSSD